MGLDVEERKRLLRETLLYSSCNQDICDGRSRGIVGHLGVSILCIVGHGRVCVYSIYLQTRYMRPEGPWQRRISLTPLHNQFLSPTTVGHTGATPSPAPLSRQGIAVRKGLGRRRLLWRCGAGADEAPVRRCSGCNRLMQQRGL